jgi:hypothetical protein
LVIPTPITNVRLLKVLAPLSAAPARLFGWLAKFSVPRLRAG